MDILYRDESVLAVAKPSGLIIHRGPWSRSETPLLSRVRDQIGQRVHPVHRLDRGTSGVLLLTLGPEPARRLGRAFAAGAVEKRYLALVRGVAPDDGLIDHPVPGREDGPRVPAVTRFRRHQSVRAATPLPEEPARGAPRYSLVEACPRTGRFHQIRRHLKHISHPIIGDVNYGRGEHNRFFRERYGLHRLALHALELTVEHPMTGERLSITAPIPADLAAPLQRVGFDLTELT
jgi:tRNA pseudouridine65 synthase